MKNLFFWTNLSALTILGITISFSVSVLPFLPAASATPFYLAQYNPSPEEQTLINKIDALLKEEAQLAINTQQKIFFILTPEQQEDYLVATQGQNSAAELLKAIISFPYNDTQAYIVKNIMEEEVMPKHTDLSNQIVALLNQLQGLKELRGQ